MSTLSWLDIGVTRLSIPSWILHMINYIKYRSHLVTISLINLHYSFRKKLHLENLDFLLHIIQGLSIGAYYEMTS